MSGRRALVIAPRLPEFDRESGLLRISDLIEMLGRRGWEVTFGCLDEPVHPERYVGELEQRGVETYAPLDSLDSIPGAADFELAILAYWHVAERFLPELRRASPSTRVIVDSVDLHFLREMRERLRMGNEPAPRQLKASDGDRLIREVNTYAAADAVLTVSHKEAELINDLTAQPGLAHPVPDVEELPRSPVPLRNRTGILFLGNFLHAPNQDAAAWLCQEIVPLIDPALLAEHEISIVGTAAEEHVQELASGLPHVKTVGWVPSVVPYLHAARLSVVPLRYGAGTKRKLLQALLAGTPTVSTPVGAEGLGVRDGRHVLIADEPHDFAAAIERLLRRSLIWRRLARRGREHVLRLHGRAVVEARFESVLDSLLSRAPRPPAVHTVGEREAARAPDYPGLVAWVREVVESAVPPDGQVLVASRGDDAFMAMGGREAWHFPSNRDGKYAGYYPADSEAAIAHLEELRAQGATHLVLPRTAFWWIDYYEGLNRHLEDRYRIIRRDEHLIVYDLAGRTDGQVVAPDYAGIVAAARDAIEADVPPGAKVLVATRGDDALVSLKGREGWHFPREPDGRYAGHNPPDSRAAIAHLEELRVEGATHLALPQTAFWWLAFYDGFHDHLEAAYPRAHSDENVIVYELSPRVEAPRTATRVNGHGVAHSAANGAGRSDPVIIASPPSALASASRYRSGARGRRALVLGVYLAGKPNTAEHIAATVARSQEVEVRQRWAALGGEASNGALCSITALAETGPAPKYALLNRLLADEDLDDYDFVVTTDDDIVLPEGFIDLFCGIQAELQLDMAQPARTLNSFVDHPIVLQQRGVLARRTLFVEIGPLVSFGRRTYDIALPFDESNPMGWGFENVWAYELRRRGLSQGIVDAVPVDHSLREPVAHYEWSDANADRDRYLARHPHLAYEECFRVLEVVGVGE